MLSDIDLQFTFLLGCRTQFRSNKPFLENGLEISKAFPYMNSYSLCITLIHIDYQPPVNLVHIFFSQQVSKCSQHFARYRISV